MNTRTVVRHAKCYRNSHRGIEIIVSREDIRVVAKRHRRSVDTGYSIYLSI